MESDNNEQQLVVRKPDGTLATRSVTSLPSNQPIDTTKNLASDFELAKYICECGTNFPPFLINSLLESGYSEQDLLEAGVSFANIFSAKPIMDLDGNIYTSITIGTQTWLRENLKTTKYSDGSDIPNITNSTTWSQTSTNESPGYSWYNNDISNKDDLGALYNWYAVSTTTNGNKNVCPTGWHVPSGSEWNTLSNYFGGGFDAGPALKESTLDFWNITGGATNSSGFNGRGNGRRSNFGSFTQLSDLAYWWSDISISTSSGQRAYISGSNSALYTSGNASKENGYGVRCIKD